MARAAESAARMGAEQPCRDWMRCRCGVIFNSQWLDEKIVHGERSADEELLGPEQG